MKRILAATAMMFILAAGWAAPVSRRAPAFKLKDFDGTLHDSAGLKGKAVFINFWASWCAPCQIELPQLNQLAKEYGDKNFILVAINVDDDKSKAEGALNKLGLTVNRMRVLLDPEGKIAAAFNAQAMPSSFILDPEGVIRAVHAGYHKKDPQKWREEINLILDKK